MRNNTLIHILLILSFCTLPNRLLAQFNDSIHHNLTINANGNLNQTQDGLNYLFNNQVRYGIKYDDFVMNTQHGYVYGRNPTRITNKDWNSSLDFNLYKTIPHFYYWGLVNYTSSLSLKINDQIQSGLGVAYKFFDKKDIQLSVSNGILFENSNITQGDTNKIHYQTFRNSLRVQFNYKLGARLTCKGIYYYQPSLTIGGDYIINTNTTIEVKLIKWLSFNAGFMYNVASRTNRENIIFNYGLVANGFF